MTAAHAAVVLAAGGGRRLGRAKQLLRRDGETLVHRAARLCAGTFPSRLLVVVGAYRDETALALADIDCELVVNEAWQQGLAGSLRISAAALAGHAGPTLMVGCDQPALEAGHLQRLLEGAATVASGCAATLHRGAPGIPAVVTPALWVDAEQLRGDRGLGHRLRELPVDAVWKLVAPELEFDIDSDADLDVAIELGLIDAPV